MNMILPPGTEYHVSDGRAVMLHNGRVVASRDTAQHPHWPPVDSDGVLIGDMPWKFFDPPYWGKKRL